MTRLLDAPRDLVWKAMIDPRHLSQWWGPHGFSNPVCEWEARQGGAIRIEMRGPDGTIYPSSGMFDAVVPPSRLAFTIAAPDPDGQPVFEVLNTLTLETEGAQTRITIEARVMSSTADAAQYLVGMREGWTQSLERLAEVATPTAEREIFATRIFAAPRDLVWRLWTEPQHIVNWWGPDGFTTTIEEMDVRAGGSWRFVMHGPDGRDYDNRNVYTEANRPGRLAYRHDSTPRFHSTVTFSEAGPEHTLVIMHMVFETVELRDNTIKTFGAVEGLQQTLGRLGKEIAQMTDIQPFSISRTFDAPRELVWKAWTESERLAQWFGPKGATIIASNNDLRPGGVYHYGMRTADGMAVWGKWIYREIVPPERLVFVTMFSDETGGVGRHPLAPTWPVETLSTITFAEDGQQTKITIEWKPINATAEERQTFEAARDGMNAGWSGTFEQLETYLAAIR